MIIKDDKQSFLDYLKDASNYKGDAEKVYIVENEDEISEILIKANQNKTKVAIQGSRTGLTGSAIPNSGIIISTEKLNKFSINFEEKSVWVQPGLKYFELSNALKEFGLFYPPNPTETTSSVGGNVGTNASGSRTFKYGATRNWVESLKIILPNGQKIQINRGEYIINNSLDFIDYKISVKDIKMPNIKHAAGYYIKPNMDLIDLFIGSEGTLGIITEIKLRLLEIPKKLIGLIFFMKNSDEMFNILEQIRNSNNELINPRLIEYFDKNSLQVLKKTYSNLKDEYHSAIWVEQEENDDNRVDDVLSEWYELITKHTSFPDDTWVATEDKQHNEFSKFRHKLPEEVYENLTSNNSFKIGTDTAVESRLFKEYYKELYQDLDALGLDYLVFGHIGNSHLHANIFYKNQKEMDLAKNFYKNLIKKTVALSGTVSAEHGIGKIKKDYLYEMFPEDIELMKKIKLTFDPNLILSPDNLFYF